MTDNDAGTDKTDFELTLEECREFAADATEKILDRYEFHSEDEVTVRHVIGPSGDEKVVAGVGGPYSRALDDCEITNHPFNEEGDPDA